MKPLLPPLVCASILIAGCANGIGNLRPVAYQEPGETRILVSYKACPSTTGRNIAPILAAIAMGIASKALEGFGNALAKGAEGGKLPSSIAATNIEVSDGELPQCVVLIRGRFAPDEKHKTAVHLPTILVGSDGKPSKPLEYKDSQGEKKGQDMPKIYDLQHYVELQLLLSQNRTAVTFAPVMTKIERSMDGSKKGSRELSIALKFETPGKPEIGSAVLISDRKVGETDRYGELDSGRFEYESPWFATIQAGPASGSPASPIDNGGGAAVKVGDDPAGSGGTPAASTEQKDGGVSSPTSQPGKPKNGTADDKSNGPFPYTVTTTLVESRPTREFLAFVASVFTTVTPAIEAGIKGKLDPAAIEADVNAGLDADATYATTLGNAHNAIITYCSLGTADDKRGERFSKSGEARKAQISANKAALAADTQRPFSSLVVVSGDDPKVANAGHCA